MSSVIRVRIGLPDIARPQFTYSPLAEVAESLYVLASGKIPTVHQAWFDLVRPSFPHLDLGLLTAVVPARTVMADIFFDGPSGRNISFEEQLGYLREQPVELLQRRLEEVWNGEPPRRVRDLIAEGRGGMHRLVDALWQYWSTAMEPHWPAIRSVLDDDVAYRVADLTKGGLATMLTALYPNVALERETSRIDLRHTIEGDLASAGLVLTPSVFVWPNVAFSFGESPPRLTYAARGVGNVWSVPNPGSSDNDALAALLGRNRAAILRRLASPHSTTDLAVRLGQSKPAVSQHLSVLRRCALVTSWRSGRSVMYQRTPLASSVIESHRSITESGIDNGV